MATVNFSVPTDIKNRFNEVFSQANKSHIITELMKQAIENYERQQQRAKAIDALLEFRSKQSPSSRQKVNKAR